MNAVKCYFPSGSKGTVTGLLFKQHVEAGADAEYFVVLPNVLTSICGKDGNNPPKLMVDGSQFEYPFAMVKPGPNTGSGGDAPSIYSYWIQFENAAPTGF